MSAENRDLTSRGVSKTEMMARAPSELDLTAIDKVTMHCVFM